MTRLPAEQPPGSSVDSPGAPRDPAMPSESTTPAAPARLPGRPAPKVLPEPVPEQDKASTPAADPAAPAARHQGSPRKAEREARRRARDEAYELRLQRKKAKDGTTWRGHHIVDTDSLAEAFPEPEDAELPAITVRRRITHAVVLVLLVSLVVAGVVLAGMVQRGELELKLGPGRPAPTPFACPSETLQYPDNKSVAVNVYNGGSAEGMAGKVGEELQKRGYQVKAIDNQAVEIPAPSVIVSGPEGRAAAFNLQRNFPNSDYVEDSREGTTVDVVLTRSFEKLVEAKKVDKSAGVLSCPRLSPPPSEPAPAGTAPAG